MENPYKGKEWVQVSSHVLEPYWAKGDGPRYTRLELIAAREAWTEGRRAGFDDAKEGLPLAVEVALSAQCPIAIEHTGLYRTRGGWEAQVVWIDPDLWTAWAFHINPQGGINSDPVSHSTHSGTVTHSVHPHFPPLFDSGHPADLVERLGEITWQTAGSEMHIEGVTGTLDLAVGGDSDAEIAESSGQ